MLAVLRLLKSHHSAYNKGGSKGIRAGHLVQGEHVQLLVLGDLAHAAIVFLGQGADLPQAERRVGEA